MTKPKRIKRITGDTFSMQLTEHNKEEVLEWIGSEGEVQDHGSFIVILTLSDRYTARFQDWIVLEDGVFSVYSNDKYTATFKGVVAPRKNKES
jgi:hypothetical protein